MKKSLSGRERNILIACLAVVFYSVCTYGFVLPLREKNDSLAREISVYRRQAARVREVLQKAGAYEEKFNAYRRRFSRAAGDHGGAALSEIEEAAVKAGIQLTEIVPQEDEDGPFVRRVAARVAVHGRFLDILRFIYVLQESCLFDIWDIEFENTAGQSGNVMRARFIARKTFLKPNKNIAEENGESSTVPVPTGQKPFEAYAQTIRRRDFFALPGAQKEMARSAVSRSLPALRQRIRLIGISLDADSRVIVEDLKDRTTHVLSMGESVGAISVEEISRDKAVFLYNNERIEMEL
jgi:Tfp pilus assembly protein PilO